MRQMVESIEAEYRRYKALGEKAMDQLDEADLSAALREGDNAIATIVWHISGNLVSRFTDFLTSDGEKPWRDRDGEFAPRTVTRAELLEKWESGWRVLGEALAPLTDADLGKTVAIRAQPLRVDEALHRSLAHTAYHVGQMVYLAKSLRGEAWRSLSIPKGASRAYNLQPSNEKPPGPAR